MTLISRNYPTTPLHDIFVGPGMILYLVRPQSRNDLLNGLRNHVKLPSVVIKAMLCPHVGSGEEGVAAQDRFVYAPRTS